MKNPFQNAESGAKKIRAEVYKLPQEQKDKQ
jgi:hypothetical protein